ncbi:hypothetical protein JHK82_036641 [Glycine max]|uniref:Uncharacterized protein n=1 Tax=Glycine max TaxID=3847 RepID=K7M0E1_SOYBN|nr:hypothetical protein JHK87_036559 [Glycine soja]KAG4970953.1 hypothetical protein JHK85_037374 [Glycine max]KAG5113372.1 hypothetical protein JHK82_036641 [Glycine max]KAG5130650.1 hypothetical protein JHK84_037047 [Glycine max]KAH1102122.1 hypothetical protein GYH30_036604 [Glycine max]
MGGNNHVWFCMCRWVSNTAFTFLGSVQDKESSHSSKLFTKNCIMLRRPLSSEDKYKNPGFM